jgi:hypothetical protein
MRKSKAWFGRVGPVLIPTSWIGLSVWGCSIAVGLLLGWLAVALLDGGQMLLAQVCAAAFALVLLAFFVIGYRQSEPW